MGLLVRVKMGWWGFGGLMRRTSKFYTLVGRLPGMKGCSPWFCHQFGPKLSTGGGCISPIPPPDSDFDSIYYSPTSLHQAYDRAIGSSVDCS
jgi:hypothetical protein